MALLGKAYAPTLAIAAGLIVLALAWHWFGWDGIGVVLMLGAIAWIRIGIGDDERG